MLRILSITLLALSWHILTTHSTAMSHISRAQCQASAHCPPGTILVSANDKSADFTTIQNAIDSLPDDTSSQTILILSGLYEEQLNVTRAGPLTLLGQTSNPKDATKNKVTITHAAANQDNTGRIDNVYSSVLIVSPTLDASLTGSGPTASPSQLIHHSETKISAPTTSISQIHGPSTPPDPPTL
ncbi:hypothetical protein PENDEC_c003G07024 [Penicillium decumbens]|uniref:Uncharacterized protein n=1 Tax=Penicillium decumbens TaxID=69771 RepID=A0A1V6PJI6_PENDC|nr:hypothetical protein PENDEC_c003G07024 [Penicillium decumbens]